jgi:hypothetical protein
LDAHWPKNVLQSEPEHPASPTGESAIASTVH